MKTELLTERAALFHGDAAHAAEVLAPESIDAIVTDPPAGIGFMGKDWDKDRGGREEWIAWLAGVMRGALRVLKPGGHALVWALPRTSHWTATALEDAGFEVRDVLMHLFGTGFPKSLNLGAGQGTALKPAAEHWILARKRFVGTVAGNVREHGTGGLNIDGCRIATLKPRHTVTGGAKGLNTYGHSEEYVSEPHEAGRWPANVFLDEDAAQLLDTQVGGATGGASRFFYIAKPSRSERDRGCEDLPFRTGAEARARKDGSAGLKSPRSGANSGGARNFHPTVKSIALMRWLCRLVTPPGGTVLDPFAGSGSTGIAALAEGFEFIGIEREAEYLALAKARIEHALTRAHESGSVEVTP